MRHHLLHRTMSLPPSPSPSPTAWTPRVAGGRLFASLPPPSLQSRREVHVWYLLPDEFNDASQLKMYTELLSPSERKTALSMNGEKLQKGAVLSRALVRTALSRFLIKGSAISPAAYIEGQESKVLEARKNLGNRLAQQSLVEKKNAGRQAVIDLKQNLDELNKTPAQIDETINRLKTEETRLENLLGKVRAAIATKE